MIEIPIPERIVEKTFDAIVDYLTDNLKDIPGGGGAADKIGKLRSDADFREQFQKGLQESAERFAQQYAHTDAELVEAIFSDAFLENNSIQKALIAILRRPDRYLEAERNVIREHLKSSLPTYYVDERIDAAVDDFVNQLFDAVWLLPEFSLIYRLLFQKMTAEGVREHVQMAKAQAKLTADVRDAIFQLTDALLEQKQLEIGGSQHMLPPSSSRTITPGNPEVQTLVDYGEAPNNTHYYGRESELLLLTDWITEDNCRLIGLFGMGGIGKTALVTSLAKHVQDNFDYVIWRSLLNAPLLSSLLLECIQFFSNQTEISIPEDGNKQISRLIAYLRKYRCLLVLDNFEAVLNNKQVGHYRAGFEDYGWLLQRLGDSQHHSCVLITSREKPREIASREGDALPIRSLQVGGVETDVGRKILERKRLHGTDNAWAGLVNHYSGNPLALTIVSEMIREVYEGSIADFMDEGAPVFGRVRDVLDEQFQRLSELEKAIMFSLAVEREATSRNSLRDTIIPPIANRELMVALRSLRRRSLIETNEAGYTLQNVIMEFMTDYLVDHIFSEIVSGSGKVLDSHPLLKADAKQYIRESQVRLYLEPLKNMLEEHFHNRNVLIDHLRMILTKLQREQSSRGYTAGSIINILIHLGTDLRDYDLSHLTIREAYLQDINLRDVNLTGADLSTSVFNDTFGSILSIAFAPTGEYLAGGTTGSEIRLWRVSDSKQLLAFEGHTGWVHCLRFDPEGRLLATGSDDRSIRLWYIKTGECAKTLTGHTNTVWSVAFEPDGQLLASASGDYTIKLWHKETGECVRTLKGHLNAVRSVVFKPDGQLLASASDDHTIKLWHKETGECVRTLEGHTGPVRALAFSPIANLLASGGEDNVANLWDINSGECISTLHGHTGPIWCLAFDVSGKIVATGGPDQTVRIWNIDSGKLVGNLLHSGWVRDIDFSPEGHVLACGGDNQVVYLWDSITGQCLRTMRGYISSVWSVAFSPDGHLIASGNEDKTVRLWAVENGSLIHTLRGHTNRVWSVAFNTREPIIASSSDDKTIRLWHVTNGHPVRILSDHNDWIWSIAFSPDGSIIAGGGGNETMHFWDTYSSRLLELFRDPISRVWSITFSPDNSLLAVGTNQPTEVLQLWDLKSRRRLKLLEGHNNQVWAVAFDSTGKILASGSGDHTVRLWNIDTGTCIKILEGHADAVWSVSFSPDDSLLASSSSDRTVKLWDVNTGICLRTLTGHNSPVWSVSFNPNGSLLASGSDDGTIRLWDAQKGECQQIFRADRPYERMNIKGTIGLTNAQRAILKELGAVEI